jgi:hypothetical protein
VYANFVVCAIFSSAIHYSRAKSPRYCP